MSIHESTAGQSHQRHLFLFARFEADGSSGRNIQSHAVSGRAIEIERGIHFEEMIMAAHLHGPVATVAYYYLRRGSPGIQFHFAVVENVFARIQSASY